MPLMCCTAVKFAPSIFPAGMTLANMGLTLGLIPFAAHLADKGLPKLAATMGVLVVAAVCSIPMLLAVSSQSMVAAWLMQVRVRPAGRHSAQNHALFHSYYMGEGHGMEVRCIMPSLCCHSVVAGTVVPWNIVGSVRLWAC